MANEYFLPSIETTPIENPTSGFLWICLDAYELKSQKVLARSTAAIIKGSPKGKFNLLAPMTINESFSHQWQNSTSPIQETAQKLADAQKTMNQVFSTTESTAEVLERANKSNSDPTNQAGVDKASLTKELNKLSQTMIDSDGKLDRVYKVDTMKTYDSSSNRKWDFSIECGFKRNRQTELLDPIRELLSLSCAEMNSEDVSAVDYPAIFTLKVGEFIIAKNVILSSVTIGWEGPYKKGLPSKATLQISLEEIEPLYRKTLEAGTSISTDSDSAANRTAISENLKRSPVPPDKTYPALKRH